MMLLMMMMKDVLFRGGCGGCDGGELHITSVCDDQLKIDHLMAGQINEESGIKGSRMRVEGVENFAGGSFLQESFLNM
jgi:hypothetical protein